jgi:hypothetical protein
MDYCMKTPKLKFDPDALPKYSRRLPNDLPLVLQSHIGIIVRQGVENPVVICMFETVIQ